MLLSESDISHGDNATSWRPSAGATSTTMEAAVSQQNDAKKAEEAETPSGEVIQTRFGPIEIFPDKAIAFERGLLGIPDSKNFVLTDFNTPNLEQFKLLQSIDNHELSFITLPLALNNAIISREDIDKAIQELSIETRHAALLLVVSVHRSPTKVTLSVNARAPLIIQAQKRQGTQYVFQHSRYHVQQPLNLESPG